jgi:hypothetical protein
MACVEEVGEEMTIRVEPYGKSLGTTTAIVAWTLTWLVCGVRENIYILSLWQWVIKRTATRCYISRLLILVNSTSSRLFFPDKIR